MRVVPLEAFRDKVPFSVAIAAVERGFRALGRGEAALPDPMVLELREQQAEGLAKELGQAVETRIAPALESAVRDHRVIVTATASTTPLVMASWVGPGTHVTSVGTGSPEKIELEPALLVRADKLVADRVFQTERYGNLHHAMAAGLVTRDKVYAELGDLAAGRLPGRESATEITVADLTGVGVQDAAIAQAVVEVLGL